MKSVLVHADVEVDDVSRLQRSRVRDPMTNYLVDGRAAATRKTIIVERRGICSLSNDEIVDNPVDLFSGHTRLGSAMPRIDGTSCDLASFAYFGDLFVGVNRWHCAAFQ